MKLPDKGSRITPTDELFTYHIFGIPEECRQYKRDVNSFALLVTGLVEREQRLSLTHIRTEFAPVSSDIVLQCTTNVHWGRVRVTGAMLLDVLDHAGIREEARKIALHGADGFDTDLRVDDVRQDPGAFLLAYSMNGEALPMEHGFPLRVTADRRYGYKWPKWVDKIELVDYDYKGHYEGKRGWSDAGLRTGVSH